jgi:hypothetical protein
MQTYIDKKNSLVCLLIVFGIYITSLTSGSYSLLLTPVLIAYLAWRADQQGISYNQNPALLIAVFVFFIMFFYLVMFDWIEVQPYLEVDDSSRSFVIRSGTSLLYSLILGSFFALSIRMPRQISRIRANPSSPRQINILFVIAWIPLLLNTVIYFAGYAGREYVEVHAAGGPLQLMLKGVYLSFGAVLLLCVNSGPDEKMKRRLIFLTIGFTLVYGLLFKLRSPLIFYLLLLFFFFGKQLSLRKLLLVLGVGLLFLIGVALLRDTTLVNADDPLKAFNMLANLGDFADTLNFAREYLHVHGPLLGESILGGIFGFGDSLGNEYARDVSVEYFDSGGGFGFFMFSEVAINFGFGGGMLVLGLLGFGLIWIHRYLDRKLIKIFLATIFASVLALVRNDIGSTFRGVLYTLVAAVVVQVLVNGYRPHSRMRYAPEI